jgi:hypothetical protein
MALEVKRTEIRDVSFGTTVIGGVVIGPNTALLPLSMVLKETQLATAAYEGSRTRPAIEFQHSRVLFAQPPPGGLETSGDTNHDDGSK